MVQVRKSSPSVGAIAGGEGGCGHARLPVVRYDRHRGIRISGRGRRSTVDARVSGLRLPLRRPLQRRQESGPRADPRRRLGPARPLGQRPRWRNRRRSPALRPR